MASRSQRKNMRSSAQIQRMTKGLTPRETALMLERIDNAAKAARNSERRRLALERINLKREGNNGTTQ